MTIDKKFIPNYGIDLNSKTNEKTKFEMLLDSEIFNPNNNTKIQDSSEMSISRGDTFRSTREEREE
ncbi:Uncharacterised protein [Mycoplasma putrefaciens]|nr:Uncharacterised protein [Mycoplasma putrefaciens]